MLIEINIDNLNYMLNAKQRFIVFDYSITKNVYTTVNLNYIFRQNLLCLRIYEYLYV